MSLRLHPVHGVNATVQKCFWCGEAMGVIMLGYNKGKEAPREMVLDHNPCDACAAKFATGILFMEMADETTPTGNYAVVDEEAALRIIRDDEARKVVMKARKVALLSADFVAVFADVLPGVEPEPIPSVKH